MERELFSELNGIYKTTKETPFVIRLRIRMRDLIDPKMLRHAVDKTMERYPYFCVELRRAEDGRCVFVDNPRPVAITNSLHGVDLNSPESNYHMIAFCWQDNWIILDVFHGMTDGTGAYEVVRTLLHYYCSDRYHVELKEEGIRLVGDEISAEEWDDPVANRTDLPTPPHNEMPNALKLVAMAGLEEDRQPTVYSIAIDESEFMGFTRDVDGSPGTTIALLLSRAIAKMYPDVEGTIRIMLCVNQRPALRAPLAHQSLVGDVRLVYDEKVDALPFSAQATSFRGKVILQSDPDIVLEEIKEYQQIVRELRALPDHAARRRYAVDRMDRMTSCFTATVSYVGKTDMGEAERFIQEFHVLPSTALPSSATPLTLELSAMNGSFYVNFMQYFENDCYLNAFIRELRENEIDYDVLYQEKTKYPGMVDFWGEE